MPFRSIEEYHHACQAQVAIDAGNGVHSIYLPNTVFTEKPKYCLITAEPSLSGMPPAAFQGLIDRGFTNFLFSRGDFVLQYCAYKFLCGENFDFIVTDLSKGAMTVNNAGVRRDTRYNAWLAILQQELMFYGNPRKIAVGRVVETFLDNNRLEAELYTRHYSGNNNADFKNFYDQHPEDQHLANDLDERLRDFIEELFSKINYPDDLRHETLNRIFRNPLPISSKGMSLEYRHEFLALVQLGENEA